MTIDSSADEALRARKPWLWSVFVLVALALLLQNISVGAFVQIETLLLIPEEERGQTWGIEFGWPFIVGGTEAFTFNLLFDGDMPYWQRVGYGVADVVICLVSAIAATRYASLVLCTMNWRPNLRVLLAAIGFFGMWLVICREFFAYQDGVGALSLATFDFVRWIAFTALACGWYFVVSLACTGIGKLIS